MCSLVQHSPPQMAPGATAQAGGQDGDWVGPTLERQGVVRRSRQAGPGSWSPRVEGAYRPSANGAHLKGARMEPAILEGEEEEAEEDEALAQPLIASPVERPASAGVDEPSEEPTCRAVDDAPVDADVVQTRRMAQRRLSRGVSTSAVAVSGALSAEADLGDEPRCPLGSMREAPMRLREGRTASLDAQFVKVRLEGHLARKGRLSAAELLLTPIDGTAKRRTAQEAVHAGRDTAAVIGFVRIEDGLEDLAQEPAVLPTACSLNEAVEDVCDLIAGLRACEARHKEAHSAGGKAQCLRGQGSLDSELTGRPSPRRPRHLWRASRSVASIEADVAVDGYDGDKDGEKDGNAWSRRLHNLSAGEQEAKGWATDACLAAVHSWPKAQELSLPSSESL